MDDTHSGITVVITKEGMTIDAVDDEGSVVGCEHGTFDEWHTRVAPKEIEEDIFELQARFGALSNGFLDELIHNAASHIGSAYCNDTIDSQIEFLVQSFGAEEASKRLQEITDEQDAKNKKEDES